MGGFFTRERFGRPQFLAGLLLLVFLGQCVWLVNRETQRHELDGEEVMRLELGLSYWGKQSLGYTAYAPLTEAHNSYADHSRMWYLIASAPLLLRPGNVEPEAFANLIWLVRIPYVLFGILLGASLWYVSRRLYGNAGGYIALTLYCFSPGMLRASTGWLAQPEVGAAWGAFGAVFTAIAVAHTLYAPREVVFWNWRRIVLLGLSLALAVGSQFSLVILVPATLAFMLYVAPTRRTAALAIWAASCGLALVLLYASYFFHPYLFWQGMRHAHFFETTWRAFAMPGAYRELLIQLAAHSPALVFGVPAALLAYIAWPRVRYFGNTAPLLVALSFLLLGLLAPHYPGLGLRLMAVPFLFVFVAGVGADLLETGYHNLVLAGVWGLLTAYALWNLIELTRVGRG
jgi:hypothetical protein